MSKLKLNLGEFKEMVAKAVTGASNNKNLYITQLMAVELSDNTLVLTTTDGSNFLYVRKDHVAGDNFYAVVPVEKFAKLIAKSTCENIELSISEGKNGQLDKLTVKGNGRYDIELPYDEDGELVEFPDPLAESGYADWKETDIQLSTIRLMLTTAKAALFVGDPSVVYSGYYMHDRVVTTDSFKICGIDISICDDPMVLPASLVNMLDNMTKENIAMYADDEHIAFVTENVSVYGTKMDNLDEFKIEPISALIDEPFPSSCKVDKSELIRLLDRLSLFVSVLDKNGVYLTFTKDGLVVSSKQDNGNEILPYLESSNFQAYSCFVDISMFTSQVKANHAQTIEIMYGKDSTIKLLDGTVKQVVALASDSDEDEEGEEDAD